MSISKWNLFCLKILHKKLFTRNIQIELRQIEHLVPDQLAEPCGNTRTLDAVVADFLMQVIRASVHWLHSTVKGNLLPCQGFGFGMLLTDVWGFLALRLFVCCCRFSLLGTSDTVRGHLESVKHDYVTLRVMVKVWGPGGGPFIEEKTCKGRDRCARMWQDWPRSSAAKGLANLVKVHQTGNGSRGGNGGAGGQWDVNRHQQGDVNWPCNQQNSFAEQDWSGMTTSISTWNEKLFAAQHNEETLITFLERQHICVSLRDGCILIQIVWGATMGNWTSVCSCRAVVSLVSEVCWEVKWALPYMFTGSVGKMSAGKIRWRITLCERPVEMCGTLHWDSW